jgi:hypothetical protein
VRWTLREEEDGFSACTQCTRYNGAIKDAQVKTKYPKAVVFFVNTGSRSMNGTRRSAE